MIALRGQAGNSFFAACGRYTAVSLSQDSRRVRQSAFLMIDCLAQDSAEGWNIPFTVSASSRVASMHSSAPEWLPVSTKASL